MSTALLISHTAKLAKLPLDKNLEHKLSGWFLEVLAYLKNLESLDTKKVTPTYQVTGLTNIFREDKITLDNDFSKDVALKNGNAIVNGMYKTEKVL